jgi:hypothetical protein
MLVFKNGEGGVVQLCMMWVWARCGKVFYVAGPVTSDQAGDEVHLYVVPATNLSLATVGRAKRSQEQIRL